MPPRSDFGTAFCDLTGHAPFRWQARLYAEWFAAGKIPDALDLPTGLGKTSVMALWLLARAAGAPLPRRLVYVVDRRAVVDQATEEAVKLSKAAPRLAGRALPISTLRGQHADNRDWLADPADPAIIVGTVDMIGSRLLFSGYGVSQGMRPYHAGFLGVDTLVLLDEAHLVPPFAALLGNIAADRATKNRFGPQDAVLRELIPPFRLLPMSATHMAVDQGEVFTLEPEDREDTVVRQRLLAKKHLSLATPLDDAKALADELVAQAWALGTGAGPARILVYCNSREDAEKVATGIAKRAKGDRKKGLAPSDIHEPALFVGARRVREREEAKKTLERLGFLAGGAAPDKPAFLIATSAGEVGVDLDADHMVCDLVAWERMVQRLGRVNRRGKPQDHAARVVVIPAPRANRNKGTPDEWHERRTCLQAPIEALPAVDAGVFDASPGAIAGLKAAPDVVERIQRAQTPPPLRPALTRALVEAWSMTSLDMHTGRPEVEPWLRGWVEEDEPRTRVVWRTWLPRRWAQGGEGELEVSAREIEAFFDAAPPHLTETLETETYRVADWFLARAKKTRDALAKPGRRVTEERVTEEEESKGETSCEDDPPPLTTGAPLAFVLTPGGKTKTGRDGRPLVYRLAGLVPEKGTKSRLTERLKRELVGATLVVDARLGGLPERGLLDQGADDKPATADAGEGCHWLHDSEGRPVVGFRMLPTYQPAGEDGKDGTAPRATYPFTLQQDAEGAPARVLPIQTVTTEDSRSTARHAQGLAEHQAWASDKAEAIAAGVGLNGDWAQVLSIAARLHDEGKRAECWQRAASAQADGRPYAKTRGPFRPSLLGGYRHEFGSLQYLEENGAFGTLPEDRQDLVRHLVAAHHGWARPVIRAEGCEDGPPSAMADRAREVALRFARLQKRWGPWGLAWWEALLRAADQQASRELDEKGPDGGGDGGGGHG